MKLEEKYQLLEIENPKRKKGNSIEVFFSSLQVAFLPEAGRQCWRANLAKYARSLILHNATGCEMLMGITHSWGVRLSKS